LRIVVSLSRDYRVFDAVVVVFDVAPITVALVRCTTTIRRRVFVADVRAQCYFASTR